MKRSERLKEEIEAFEDVASYEEHIQKPLHQAVVHDFETLLSKEDFSGKQILEVGCGTSPFFSCYRKASEIFLIDLNERLLKRTSVPSHVRRIVADGSRLCFRNGSMDAVILFGVLHHFPDQRAGLEEVKRVLSREGKLFLVEPHTRSLNSFYRFLRLVGLRVIGKRGVKALIGCFSPEEGTISLRTVCSVFRNEFCISARTLYPFRLPPFRLFKKTTLEISLNRFLNAFPPTAFFGTLLFVIVERNKNR